MIWPSPITVAPSPIDYDYLLHLGQPKYWLFGFVPTNVPGYREIICNGVHRSIGGNGLMNAEAWMTELGSPFGDIFDEEGYGILACDFGWSPITFPDRSGCALGIVDRPGVALGAGYFHSTVVSPIRIPLVGATWRDVMLDRETVSRVDRHHRSGGYAWGGARVWRLVLVMHRWSLAALATGWVLRGRSIITTDGGDPTSPGAMSGANPDGYLDGRIAQVERVRWLAHTELMAEVTILFATA